MRRNLCTPRSPQSIRSRTQVSVFYAKSHDLGNRAASQSDRKRRRALTVKETRSKKKRGLRVAETRVSRRKCRRKRRGSQHRFIHLEENARRNTEASKFFAQRLALFLRDDNRVDSFGALMRLGNHVAVTRTQRSGIRTIDDDNRVLKTSAHFIFSSMNSARRVPPSPVSVKTSPEPPRLCSVIETTPKGISERAPETNSLRHPVGS